MRLGSVLACAAAAPLLVAASQPVRLQPSSNWDLDYAENSCRLIRTFGDGRDKTVFGFESPGPGAIDMLIIGKPLGSYDTGVSAKFLPGDNKPFTGRRAKATTSGQPAILWSNVPMLPEPLREQVEKKAAEAKPAPGIRPPPIDLKARAEARTARQAFAAATTELQIETRPNRYVILETGSLAEPLKAFDQCTRDSLRDWGVDPDIDEKIVRPVWADNRSRWFSANDYPADMLVHWSESEVSARLLVDPTGNVTSCTSLSHFDAPEFNTVVCNKLKQRAHFDPAELADGTKVASYYTLRVKFQIAR